MMYTEFYLTADEGKGRLNPSSVTPAGASTSKSDVLKKWGDNTHKHMNVSNIFLIIQHNGNRKQRCTLILITFEQPYFII